MTEQCWLVMQNRGHGFRPTVDIAGQPGTPHARLEDAEREAAGVREQGDVAMIVELTPVHDDDLALSLTGMNWCDACCELMDDDEPFVHRPWGKFHARCEVGEWEWSEANADPGDDGWLTRLLDKEAG